MGDESASKCLIVAYGSQCSGTHKDMSYLNSDHEEAYTKLLLHALDAKSSDATTIHIHSPDTDVFVLSLRRYPELCEDTSFVTGVGQKRRVMPLQPIAQALGMNKLAALSAFHAISGADNTGRFAGKGKAFEKVPDEIITAMASLGTSRQPPEEVFTAIETCVCHLYLPDTKLTKVSELRWWIFKRRQAQSEKLPPTQDALHQTILRAHHQMLVWNNALVPNPNLPSPDGFGWKFEGNEWVPTMTTQLAAPSAVIHLVKCGRIKTRCSTNQCQCRKPKLNCTDLCNCSHDEDNCENSENMTFEDKDESESDEEEEDVNEI